MNDIDNDKAIEWLDRLRDGVANSNSDAERIVARAMRAAGIEKENEAWVKAFREHDDCRKDLLSALSGLVEKYEEIVLSDDVGRSMEDIALANARAAIAKAEGADS